MYNLEVGDGSMTNLINQIAVEKLVKMMESKGYHCVSDKDADKYVDVQKSMKTEPFYDLLVEAIESGALSLEQLIGKVALKKLLDATVTPKKK